MKINRFTGAFERTPNPGKTESYLVPINEATDTTITIIRNGEKLTVPVSVFEKSHLNHVQCDTPKRGAALEYLA